MHTEAEAATQWCPFTRVGSTSNGGGGLNRDFASGTISQSECIASRCMAWRWGAAQKRKGFCGLAGRPTASKRIGNF